ncbi:probable disease resistance RPP8-like protein 2 [Telopea speciosissima]|uniref:probable disease resistance RPP8-like protein 2 n=1 Tax=Telopea speciosissima TaxID=54955 RepID=UPI001CC6FAC4|nr:probable disease resistance RPP8-like protein 2 [Telopea speciosissima]
MKQLTYFRCLNTYGLSCHTHDNKPLLLVGLKNLSTLVLPWNKELQLEYSLPTLAILKKLRLYDIDNAETVMRLLYRCRWDRLQCLSLHFRIPFHNYIRISFPSISSYGCLWKMHLSGELKKLPSYFPPNLTKLLLESDKLKEDPIPTLETITNLESLLLYSDGYGITKYCFSAKGFGRLRYLRLGFLYNLEELEVENGALPCLVHLQIKDCERLRMLPERLRFITTLKKLEVIDMPDRFSRRLRKYGEDCYKIQHIPSVTIQRT